MRLNLSPQRSEGKVLRLGLVLFVFWISSMLGLSELHAQQAELVTVTGQILDDKGVPLPSVTIIVENSTKGVSTDIDGRFEIRVRPTDRLKVSFLGFEDMMLEIGSQREFVVKMTPKANELDEVTVVAFGKQRKESVISSIQTINVKELRVPASNLTTALSGRIAGVISYQTSGEPGKDNAQFFIRGVTSFGTGKVDPLILIDNVEVTSEDMARLHPDDIASFSILKDATATALYGARGANGVVLISTKEGQEGRAKLSLRFENTWSMPTRQIELADPITYMKLANEATLTRTPGELPYSNEKIENTQRGLNPYVYPCVDWMDMLTKNITSNQRANLNISGGGKVARYYVAAALTQDNGTLKVDKMNNFNNNVNYKTISVRSNTNLNVTKSTEIIVRVSGSFRDYKGPIPGGEEMYKNILKVSPVRFPAKFPAGVGYAPVRHIMFGGYEKDSYYNPYADMMRGYKESSSSTFTAQLELKQDFDQWIKGLSMRIMGNTIRNSSFSLSRSYKPFYYSIASYDWVENSYTLSQINKESGEEFLRYYPGGKEVISSFYGEASINYVRDFGKHGVSGMLVGTIRNELNGSAGDLASSLPKRNLGLAGRFTYNYDKRYFAEFNFGYNGSEKFDKHHRWGFFPSVGVGWIISNESFWGDGTFSKIISKLKLRGTYGLAGNDEIGAQRFFYLSNVAIGGGGGYTFGENFDNTRNGVEIIHYPNAQIGWETSYKTNLGFDMSLFNDKVEIIADIFKEHRTNILQPRADIPSSMGLWTTPTANVGKADSEGIDLSVDYNQSFNKDAWMIIRGNFTFAKSTYNYYEEPDFSTMPWRSRIGRPVSQEWGYVAERLFIDEADVEHSPKQEFGEYGPGDIKYKDINKDGKINGLDAVPIGYPTRPQINYGFGVSAGYKNFDISCYFHGQARSSFWIDPGSISPFVTGTKDGRTLENGLMKFIADDHWAEDNQNPYAAWPRLSRVSMANNNQRSTWFMRDGDFLRCKNAEIGYTLPEKSLRKVGITSLRLYLSATNLFVISKFDLWDVEMGGNGLGYPLQRSFNVGINVIF